MDFVDLSNRKIGWQFKNNAIGIWVLAGESIEEWLKIKFF